MGFVSEIRKDLAYLKLRLDVYMEKPLRDYVHKKVQSKVIIDENALKEAQKCLDKISESQKDNPYFKLYNFDLKRVTKKAKFSGKEVPVNYENAGVDFLGNIYSSDCYMSRFNEKEKLFIMGHEIAHRMMTHMGPGAASLILKDNKELVMPLLRLQEHQADMLGTYLAIKAGGDLNSSISAIRKFSHKQDFVYQGYMSWVTHPTPAERIAYIRRKFSMKKIEDEYFKKRQSVSFSLLALRDGECSDITMEETIKNLKELTYDTRKNNGFYNKNIKAIREYIKENPEIHGLQVYLDTKHVLATIKKECIIAKIVPKSLANETFLYQKEEIKMFQKLASDVLKLPEVAMFKNTGLKKVLNDTKTVSREKDKNYSR